MTDAVLCATTCSLPTQFHTCFNLFNMSFKVSMKTCRIHYFRTNLLARLFGFCDLVMVEICVWNSKIDVLCKVTTECNFSQSHWYSLLCAVMVPDTLKTVIFCQSALHDEITPLCKKYSEGNFSIHKSLAWIFSIIWTDKLYIVKVSQFAFVFITNISRVCRSWLNCKRECLYFCLNSFCSVKHVWLSSELSSLTNPTFCKVLKRNCSSPWE